MTRIRLIMLAAFAMLCMSAVASAAASASEGKLIKTGSATKEALTKNKFTATSGETKLQIADGQIIVCSADTASGVITSTTVGEQTVKFTGCKSKSAGTSCKSVSPAGAAGEIITLTALEVSKLNATQDTITNKILKPGTTTKEAGEVEISCSGVIIKVKGTFYSNGVTTGTKGTSIALSATQSGGKQTVQENEAKVKTHLEAEFNGSKVFEEAGEEGTETVKFEESAEFV